MLIAELSDENLVLTFVVVPASIYDKFPPAVISPNVDTLFTDNIDVGSRVDCFESKDVLRLTPPLVIVSQEKSLNVKSVVVVN